MATLGRVAHPQIQRPGTSYTTQSRFGSFTYKRFTVPQEVHRSAKRVSRLSLSDHLKKPFSFALQRRPGRTSPPPPEAETVRPLMSWEPPQCSHVLLGMDNYSPRYAPATSRVSRCGFGGWPTHKSNRPDHQTPWVPHPDAALSRMGGMNKCPRASTYSSRPPHTWLPSSR
jgi:hypothetical protein